jgi:hypothetical protein
MKRLLAAALACVGLRVVSTGAVQLPLDRRALEEAIYIGQSRIESERTRFHTPYRVRVSQPPIDWVDVITPFHRVELAAEANARAGNRMMSQREALSAIGDAPKQIDLLIEMSFHPQNTFIAVPLYEVELLVAGNRVGPQRVDRYPRSGPRSDSPGPSIPNPSTSSVFNAGAPVTGGTIVAIVDGATLTSTQRIDLIVRDGKNQLARVPIDLGPMR